ncbi:MAG: hypothetical protein KO253_00160 [Methanobrevibacter arboriphilus]|nr:hypothetical protein [Methanobrevibacter arboriphilus]
MEQIKVKVQNYQSKKPNLKTQFTIYTDQYKSTKKRISTKPYYIKNLK